MKIFDGKWLQWKYIWQNICNIKPSCLVSRIRGNTTFVYTNPHCMNNHSLPQFSQNIFVYITGWFSRRTSLWFLRLETPIVKKPNIMVLILFIFWVTRIKMTHLSVLSLSLNTAHTIWCLVGFYSSPLLLGYGMHIMHPFALPLTLSFYSIWYFNLKFIF